MSLRCREADSPNQDDRPGGSPVDLLVLHYTGMRTAAAALERLRDPAARVSAHYVVEEDGTVWRLVPEARRAWHAGLSHWRGREGLNGRSIGIEVVNPGHEFGYQPFPALQMAAVADLCLEILARHPIAARDVVAHSDIAPDRKADPGELFDWEGLAGCGIGLWPGRRTLGREAPGRRAPGPAAAPDAAGTLPLLRRVGYRDDLPLPVLLTAFQRHWRPERIDGLADAETLARLAAVAALCGEGPEGVPAPDTAGAG